MVTQDTSLLHRTVRENIAYGRPDATDDEIIFASKQAQAWDFIKELYDDKGNTALDTQVGERGVKLSGGQRQRIAISRVMLKMHLFYCWMKPPVRLILRLNLPLPRA